MFWNGDPQGLKGVCAKDGQGHDAAGFNFVIERELPASENIQPDWRFCPKCFSTFWNAAPLRPDGSPNKGVCAKDGQGHDPVGFNFVLSHDTNPLIQLIDESTRVQVSGQGFIPKGRVRIGYSYTTPFGAVFGNDPPIEVEPDNNVAFRVLDFTCRTRQPISK